MSLPPPIDPAQFGAPERAVLVTHPTFRAQAFGRHHPLSVNRQAAVLDLIAALGWWDEAAVRIAPLAERDELMRFHAPAYLDALERCGREERARPEDRERYNLGSMECPVFPGLWTRARASVGGSILAARLALAGYLPFHPGGGTHHGRADRASGFCYLNDPVFAVLTLLDAGLRRVVYVDLDAHHGDGVEEAFASEERVHAISIHEDGRWPGTGSLHSAGGGRAINLPVPRGLGDAGLDAIRRELLRPLLARLEPEAVVVTFGADGLRGDPLSAMALSNVALWRACADCVAGAPRAVILGGGGYNPWTTARLWAGLWGLMRGQVLPDVLPQAAQDVLGRLTCDLVDRDDVDPAWLATLADTNGAGEVSSELSRRIGVLRDRLPA